MTLGSLFDGIGGWLLAAKHAGVTPIWASEIDEFPAAVTAHHFPDVRQMGDITKIDVDELEPVDIICAGSPCQDLSVAGKREGLAGERSGLFRTAVKLVHGLRQRTGSPRYFVWENVPGAFSSNKGLDFRAVLSEITETEIPMPKDGRWAEAGYVEWGGTCSLAWRTLDAQYWGVPQRRARIFLVADFDGRSAAEILFVEQRLPRDSTESEGAGQEAAGNVGTSIDSASGFKYRQGAKAGGIGWQNGKAPTLELSQNCAIYDMTHADEVMRPVRGDKSNCLNSRMGTGGNQVPVIHTIAGNIIGRANQNGGHQPGIGYDVSPTLNTVDRHAVAYCVGNGQAEQTRISDKVGALNCMHDQQCVMTYQKTIGSLCADDMKGINNQYVNQDKCVIQKSVRRLTPVECERLQGLPDGYTDVEYKGKPAPDSKRYKALGNGMAQPCADYVIRRIVEVNADE